MAEARAQRLLQVVIRLLLALLEYWIASRAMTAVIQISNSRRVQPQLRDLAACARVLPTKSRFLKSEGAGNAGRWMRPQPRMQIKVSIQV